MLADLPQTRPGQCGCDALQNDGLISFDEAVARVSRFARPIVGSEVVTLNEAQGRVLLDPIRALGMVPPFCNAAMDGFAIKTHDLDGNGPWELPVAGRIAAGDPTKCTLDRGTAVQIFTGAPVPDGANAVVMQEAVTQKAGCIIIKSIPETRAHIRAAGEDMSKGKIVLPAGTCLTARDIAVCAAAGHAKVKVVHKVKVALLVTGDEVTETGSNRTTAGIWDINTPVLSAAIRSPAIDLSAIELVRDIRSDLAAKIAALSPHVDLIVTTGGISVGAADHVKPAFDEWGAEMIFSGVAIKPGKPVSLGRLGKTMWLGLPGNPLSAFVMWHVFGRPLRAALAGHSAFSTQRRHVVLAEPLHHKPGRFELRPARITGHDAQGREVVTTPSETHSGRVATLPLMDGLLCIPAETEVMPSGALVELLPF